MGTFQPYRLEWANSFDVGIDAIDRQHRELIDLLNAFADAAFGNDASKCQGIAARFFKVLASHFELEERCLFKAGYPRAKEHADEHRAKLAALVKIRDSHLSDPERGGAASCYDALLEFLIGDLLESDLKYKSHIQELAANRRLVLAH